MDQKVYFRATLPLTPCLMPVYTLFATNLYDMYKLFRFIMRVLVFLVSACIYTQVPAVPKT